MELSYKDRFIRSKQRNLTKNTLEGYESDIKTFFNKIMESNKCSELEAIDMVTPEFVEDYVFESQTSETYSKSTLNRQLASLTSFYDYMIDTLHKVTRKNPFKNIERYGETDPQARESLSLEDTKKLLAKTYETYGDRLHEFSSARARLIISLMTTTGMRIEEVVSIEDSFLEKVEDDYIIAIPKELSKNGQPRRVPICGKTKQYYYEYLVQKEKLCCSCSDSKYLILSNNKKKMTPNNSRLAIQKYVKRLGIEKNIGNHSFRHTFRTVATMNNANEGLICCIGGWSRKGLRNQSDIYLHDTSELDLTKINICKNIL